MFKGFLRFKFNNIINKRKADPGTIQTETGKKDQSKRKVVMMSKTLKNKAASMALFATMMAVGTLPLAAQAPGDFFLESSDSIQETAKETKNIERSANHKVTIDGAIFEKIDNDI
jgi:hypothetical protein